MIDSDSIDPIEKDEETKNMLSQELLQFFQGELNPVAPKAQKKVPVPEE